MYTGYLIEKYNNMGNAYTCKRILEEAAKQDIRLQMVGTLDSRVLNVVSNSFDKNGVTNGRMRTTAYINSDDPVSYIDNDGHITNDFHHSIVENHGKYLEKVDVVLNRYKYGTLKNAINQLGRSYNEIGAFNRYISKSNQLQDLHDIGCDIPAFMVGTGHCSFSKIAEIVGLPFVMKQPDRSMGQGIYLIQNQTDYGNAVNSEGPDMEWVFEQCIQESLGRDLRLYSIRGEVIAAMTRTQPGGEFRANVALGAQVEKQTVTEEMQKIAGRIYEQTGLDFLGIDLLLGRDRLWFCEINVMPGIEGMESATGVNIAGAVMETIRSDLDASV